MPRAAPEDLNPDVFINCPFDDGYWPLFRAIVFAIHAAGYRSRCALEDDTNGELRLDRLKALIGACDRGVHDLSRVELSRKSRTPRFNMPFEFGVAVGASAFGGSRQKRKRALVLAGTREEWHPTVSDLSGIDPRYHENNPRLVIKAVRDFLGKTPDGRMLPGVTALWNAFQEFQKDLPRLAKEADHTLDEAHEYASYVTFVAAFLTARRG
ncbi:MAG: hypothetical protein NW200_02500 [Hyphomonadaceae bacterium]|nr:hypothetical protein [Hyphomonadaceae bacterium]